MTKGFLIAAFLFAGCATCKHIGEVRCNDHVVEVCDGDEWHTALDCGEDRICYGTPNGFYCIDPRVLDD